MNFVFHFTPVNILTVYDRYINVPHCAPQRLTDETALVIAVADLGTSLDRPCGGYRTLLQASLDRYPVAVSFLQVGASDVLQAA